MPVAQTLVLRRVLTGGISTNSGRRFFLAQYGSPLEGCPGTVGRVRCGLVFGTLLGPEATGPGQAFLSGCVAGGLFVSGFAALITWLLFLWGRCVWGVWYGVVV